MGFLLNASYSSSSVAKKTRALGGRGVLVGPCTRAEPQGCTQRRVHEKPPHRLLTLLTPPPAPSSLPHCLRPSGETADTYHLPPPSTGVRLAGSPVSEGKKAHWPRETSHTALRLSHLRRAHVHHLGQRRRRGHHRLLRHRHVCRFTWVRETPG